MATGAHPPTPDATGASTQPLPPAAPFAALLQETDAGLRVRLPVFEGPLDLLLFLIRRNEVDIYDIPIVTVTRQYLDVLRTMERLRLDIAGEFFVVAATLMEIKSRMLLPRDLQAAPVEDGEDGADPRWELVHQLLQYRKFKDAAAGLADCIRERQDLLPRPEAADREAPQARPLSPVDRIELWNTFNQVLRRLADRLVVGEIHDEQVTIVDQMELVLTRLRSTGSFRFTSLFADRTTLYTVIVTFLACLELCRLRQLAIRQDTAFDDFHCTRIDAQPQVDAPPAATTPAPAPPG